MAGRLWTDEERLAAFVLYLRLPTNLISSEENPDIQALAHAINRTPGSIAFKLQNFLAYDPNATRAGFRNASKVDRQIWSEYAERGDAFVGEAIEAYRTVMARGTFVEHPKVAVEYEPREGQDVKVAATRRLNQDYFRKSLLEVYDYKCCVTGLNALPFLVASHIKPWRDSDPLMERVNVENGLLLNTLHDRAFDKGFISLSDSYEILVSHELRGLQTKDESGVVKWICSSAGSRISVPRTHRPNQEFLEYHRDVVFRG